MAKFALLFSVTRITYSSVFPSKTLTGSVMVGVIMFSRRFNINPDNVATPIAASLGDLTTISLLAVIARVLYRLIDTSCLPVCS